MLNKSQATRDTYIMPADSEPVYTHPLSAVAVFYKAPTNTLGVRYRCVMSGHKAQTYGRDYSLDHGADAWRCALDYLRECGHGELVRDNELTIGALPNSSDYVLTIGRAKPHLIT